MTEAYLQEIWAKKRIPVNLKLTDGRALLVHAFGEHNTQLAGPDFHMGSVTIDGIRLFGNIEIHVRSSEWEKHGHHKDPLYSTVILHVVYEDDKPLSIRNERIPTLELKSIIDHTHYEAYVRKLLRQEDFPCRSGLSEIMTPYFENVKARALRERMHRRAALLNEIRPDDRFNVFYHAMGLAFGMSVNRHGFESLVRRVPYYALKGLQVRQKYQLLLTESNLIYGQMGARGAIWHYRGTRPANFPDVRVRQFACLASRYDFDTSFVYLKAGEFRTYFEAIAEEIWSVQQEGVPRLSKSFLHHLMINAVVPFLWNCAERYEDSELHDKAIALLESLPPERNNVLRKWAAIGVKPENAYDSQALMSLFEHYCCRKKCLSCEVGNKVLNRAL